jgi:hypothetical protein
VKTASNPNTNLKWLQFVRDLGNATRTVRLAAGGSPFNPQDSHNTHVRNDRQWASSINFTFLGLKHAMSIKSRGAGAD